jgi:hypothetical protein
MPAASPVRRRSGACSGDAWELHLVNTERLSDDVALSDLLFHFFFASLGENRLLAEIVGLSSAYALPTKIVEP